MPVVPHSVLITGANRGIGLGLVREWSKLSEVQHIFATTRDKNASQELNHLAETTPKIHVIEMDVQSDASIKSAYEVVNEKLHKDGLNLLINNAGTLKLEGGGFPNVDRAEYLRHIDINTVSPAVVAEVSFGCKAFLPLLKMGAATVSTGEFGVGRAAIINISSILGSIGDNREGSARNKSIAYRISKAGLNQLTKTLAVDLANDGILVTSFCPGWVKTDMGGEKADITVDESATTLVKSMLALNRDFSGAFLRRDGVQYNY